MPVLLLKLYSQAAWSGLKSTSRKISLYRRFSLYTRSQNGCRGSCEDGEQSCARTGWRGGCERRRRRRFLGLRVGRRGVCGARFAFTQVHHSGRGRRAAQGSRSRDLTVTASVEEAPGRGGRLRGISASSTHGDDRESGRGGFHARAAYGSSAGRRDQRRTPLRHAPRSLRSLDGPFGDWARAL